MLNLAAQTALRSLSPRVIQRRRRHRWLCGQPQPSHGLSQHKHNRLPLTAGNDSVTQYDRAYTQNHCTDCVGNSSPTQKNLNVQVIWSLGQTQLSLPIPIARLVLKNMHGRATHDEGTHVWATSLPLESARTGHATAAHTTSSYRLCWLAVRRLTTRRSTLLYSRRSVRPAPRSLTPSPSTTPRVWVSEQRPPPPRWTGAAGPSAPPWPFPPLTPRRPAPTTTTTVAAPTPPTPARRRSGRARQSAWSRREDRRACAAVSLPCDRASASGVGAGSCARRSPSCSPGSRRRTACRATRSDASSRRPTRTQSLRRRRGQPARTTVETEGKLSDGRAPQHAQRSRDAPSLTAYKEAEDHCAASGRIAPRRQPCGVCTNLNKTSTAHAAQQHTRAAATIARALNDASAVLHSHYPSEIQLKRWQLANGRSSRITHKSLEITWDICLVVFARRNNDRVISSKKYRGVSMTPCCTVV